jgi:hypothetical protein
MSLMGNERFGIEAGIEACGVWMRVWGLDWNFPRCWDWRLKDGCIDGLLAVGLIRYDLEWVCDMKSW